MSAIPQERSAKTPAIPPKSRNGKDRTITLLRRVCPALDEHRRGAATALALESVPVIVRTIGDPLEAERILIESNRQREKTPSERMHEADHLTRIFAEDARRRMLAGVTEDGAGGRGNSKNPRATLHEGLSRTDTAVAETIGMKQRTYAKAKKVYDAATGDKAPEPVRAVAQQQMAALDAEETPPLEGLGMSVASLRAIFHDDVAVLDVIDAAVQRKSGVRGPGKAFDNVQSFIPPAPTGNSQESALRRLRKDRTDLHELVLNGERAAKLASMRRAVDDLVNEPLTKHGGDHLHQDNNIMVPPVKQHGTSREYTLRRLKRDAPELAEMVLNGELSANAAAIEAGFRKRATPLVECVRQH